MTRTQDPTVEVVVLHLSGAVATQDCVALFASPLFRDSQTGAVRVLFDWRSLERWAEEDWSAPSADEWAAIARPLARIALVHPSAWKRQAAMFGAILRREKVPVRSWKPGQTDAALAWLTSDVAGRPASADRTEG